MPYSDLNYKECVACQQKAGWRAVFFNFALALFKGVIGLISGSKAILGDAMYSFKDFMTSLVVLAGIKISGKPPDDEHPYGHGKIEYVAMFLVSLFITIGTMFLFIHSVKEVWYVFRGHEIGAPNFIAFWAALISVAANFKLSNYLTCVGTKLNSPAMLANAKHNHSDAESSAMVACAILGTRFGFHFLDPLVAVIETLDLIRLSISMINESLKGMLDSTVSNLLMSNIRETAGLVPGVKKIPKLIVRKVGSGIWIDISINVDKDHSLEEGYLIASQVKETLKKKIGNVTGINLSIEPHII